MYSVVKISMLFAKYFEYYTIILRGAVFWGHAVFSDNIPQTSNPQLHSYKIQNVVKYMLSISLQYK